MKLNIALAEIPKNPRFIRFRLGLKIKESDIEFELLIFYRI